MKYPPLENFGYEHIYPDSKSDLFQTTNFYGKLKKRTPTSRAEVGTDDIETELPVHTYLFHRLILSAFALCLLWTTTLRTSTLIASNYVSIPSLDSVINHCYYAWQRTTEEQQRYKTCIDRQLKVCNIELLKYNVMETTRVHKNVLYNQGLSTSFQTTANNCSTAYWNAKTTLSTWVSAGQTNTLIYANNCTGTRKSTVAALLGDISANQKQTIYTTSSDYTLTSNARIQYLVQYSHALSSYNHEYIMNKTGHLRMKVVHTLPSLSTSHFQTIQAEFQGIQSIVDNIFACVTLSDSSSTTCSYGMSFRTDFIIRMTRLNDKINTLYGTLSNTINIAEDYSQQALRAMENANRFYASIQGATGLISWINQNLPVSGTLCGKSNPNWCDFTEV
jgi:hypothetical protein